MSSGNSYDPGEVTLIVHGANSRKSIHVWRQYEYGSLPMSTEQQSSYFRTTQATVGNWRVDLRVSSPNIRATVATTQAIDLIVVD